MRGTIEHFKDHYRVIWEDGTKTEYDTYEEAERDIYESEDEEA